MKTLYTFAVMDSKLAEVISSILKQKKKTLSISDVENVLIKQFSGHSDSVAYYFQFMAGWDCPAEKVAGIYFGEQDEKNEIKHYEIIEPFWSKLLSEGWALVDFSERYGKFLKLLNDKKIIKRAGKEPIAEYEVRNLLFALADGLQFAKSTRCKLLILKRVVGASLGDNDYK